MRKLQTGITCYESLGAIGGSVTLDRNKIESFGYLNYKKYLNLYPKYGQELYINSYQHSRCYLDEYPEQKELRRNWLGDWYSKNKWHFQLTDTMKNFSDMIGVAGFIDDNFPDWSTGTVSGCKFYDFQIKFAEEIVDRYHERRWLRRN